MSMVEKSWVGAAVKAKVDFILEAEDSGETDEFKFPFDTSAGVKARILVPNKVE